MKTDKSVGVGPDWEMFISLGSYPCYLTPVALFPLATRDEALPQSIRLDQNVARSASEVSESHGLSTGLGTPRMGTEDMFDPSGSPPLPHADTR